MTIVTDLSSALSQYAPLLNALDGVVYLTDFQGDFLAWGRDRWSGFAAENGAPHLRDPAQLNTIASCSDPETAAAYRTLYRAFESGKLDSYSFGLRCDTPRLKRELRMALSLLVLEGQRLGIVHHCVALSETERPLVRMFQTALAKASADRPMIRMCSYCLRVADPEGWIEPEQYYARGGLADVNISHGICMDCHERIVAPILRLN